MEALETPLIPLANALGLPMDIFKALFSVLICIPLGWIQCLFITDETLGLAYSLIVGLALAVLQYDFSGMYVFFMTSGLVYLILKTVRRDRVALPVLIVSFSALSGMHIERMMNDWMGWKMDASGLQMMATLKFISLAYCYQDGLLHKTHPDSVPLYSRSNAIETLPSLFEYYSYLCSYGGFCIGPFSEYSEFSKYIKRKSVFSNIPSPIVPSLVRLFEGLTLIAIYLLTSSYFDAFHCTTDEFAAQSLLYKSMYMIGLYVKVEGKYFGGWKLSEAALIATGLSYSGKDWDRCKSIKCWPMWSSSTLKPMVDNWNISVTIWLRKYVYIRVITAYPKSRGLAQMSTLMVSAFWHGFYPAYYIFYLNVFFLNSLVSMIQNRNIKVPKVVSILSSLAMHYSLLFIGLAFLTLGFYESFKAYAAFHFIPLIGVYLLWIYFKFGPKVKGEKEL